MRPEDQYHVGTVVDDFDGTVDWLSATVGYRWCEEINTENLLVSACGEQLVPLRFTYSMDEPHVEVVQAVPGTLFVATPRAHHHIGYWSDDIEADLASIEDAGAVIDGRGYWPDGSGPIWAFASPPSGGRIELVGRNSQASLQRWWATGLWGSAR